MNLIIPMAGQGKRLRPHTLTTPKPLIEIAGKPIVHWLAHDIVSLCSDKVENIGFVIGRSFGKEVEDNLIKVAGALGAKGHIFYQDEPMGTAHAIFCAQDLLKDKVIVAFADTLFKAEFQIKADQDSVIWVKQVEDPSAFGVVKLNDQNHIVDFVEKPKEFVSDLAIIGIYYFKNGIDLYNEIKELIDNNIKDSGEFQLTRVLKTLQEKGTTFVPGQVDQWLDCGNKEATVGTHKTYLDIVKDKKLVSDNITVNNSVLIEPVFIGENVEINDSVIGPYVSIGERSIIRGSRIQNSIIQKDNSICNANLANSMLGNFVIFEGKATDLSVGDYNIIQS